ncbi:MAG: ABC transporter permease, partial [Candidatus Ventricola sp.]
MFLMLKYALLSATVLMLVALGGCFSEHSGVINLALEGIMVIGGLMGILVLNLLPADTLPVWKVALSIAAAAVAGVIYSALLAFSAINLKADQTIGGTALNLLSTAIAMVVAKRFNGSQSAKLSYDNTPFMFQIGGLTVNVFLFISIVLLILSIIVLYKTRFGLRLQACGEHPQAADSVGINVYKMRWSGVLISGFLAGIGGFAYIVPAVQVWNFEVGVAGMGFLALAVMIFGQWKPGRIALAAIFFAIFKSL